MLFDPREISLLTLATNKVCLQPRSDVTPEMISAGVIEYQQVKDSYPAQEMVEAVYRSMFGAK